MSVAKIIRQTGIGMLVFVGLLQAGCAAGPQDPAAARAAVHRGDVGPLFQSVALEVKKHYPTLEVIPQQRMVKTAWHPLPFKESNKTGDEQVWGARKDGKDANAGYREFKRNSTEEEIRYYIRFDVRLVAAGAPGGNQWQVVVTGQASRYDFSGVPVRLEGAEQPYWLESRRAALEVAIYRRLRKQMVVRR